MTDRYKRHHPGAFLKLPTALCLLVWSGLLASPAGASTFRVMTQAELVQQSQAVVVVRILDVESYWNDEHTMILTDALLEVEEIVVGRTGATVVRARTFGGEVGGYRVDAQGFPTFPRGERLLVFLGAEKSGVHRIVGYQLGQYRVTKDRTGAEVAVPMVDKGVRLLDAQGRPAPLRRRERKYPLFLLQRRKPRPGDHDKSHLERGLPGVERHLLHLPGQSGTRGPAPLRRRERVHPIPMCRRIQRVQHSTQRGDLQLDRRHQGIERHLPQLSGQPGDGGAAPLRRRERQHPLLLLQPAVGSPAFGRQGRAMQPLAAASQPTYHSGTNSH